MHPPTVTFLGGVREIGGNKVVVEDGPDRVLFDFGPSFSPRYDDFYVNFLQPRSSSPVKDLLEFDLLPRVPGLYSKEALQGSDLPYEPPAFAGVFVSHAHFDHAGYLHLIDPEIPVYVGDGTKRLLDAIQTSGRQKYGSHPWRIVRDGRPIALGNLEVVPHPVDHSVPFAYGYVVRTKSAGTFAYTGDFRQHGPRAALTADFLAAVAKDGPPSALAIEGTRAGPDHRQDLTEGSVRSGLGRLLETCSTLAIFSSYPRDLDRLSTAYASARSAGRQLVVSLKTAYLLSYLSKILPPEVPVPGKSGDLLVYQRPKKIYLKFERPFLGSSVDADYVRAHGPELLLSLDLHHFAELIDIRPPRGSLFVRSMSEPFSEDDVDDQVLRNWLDHFGLPLHQLHASGHCSGPELRAIVAELKPKATYPIHTEHPEAFGSRDTGVISPEKGVAYPIA